VVAQTVHLVASAPARSLPGVIRARVESDLGFRVAGKITRRLVDSGQVVAPGQALAELDPIDLGLQLQSAQAELRAAKAARDASLSEMARVESLHRSGWMAGTELDRQRSQAEDARGRYDRAERAVQLAQNATGYGVLRADAAGVVTATMAEPGQVVQAGQTVMRLARLDEREAAVAVPEAMIDDALHGQASVTLWALPGRAFPARLRELSPNADPATRTYAARYSLPDAPADALLGMTATVTLSRPGAAVARLPLSAILDQGAGPTVWVVDRATGALTQRPVSIASFGQTEATVAAGLSEGDIVVTLGAQKLDAGQRVRVVDAL
jgi:RND family efflux transporter MFP subunit